MAAPALDSAPVLCTPDTPATHRWDDGPPARPPVSDEQLRLTYEIERTVRELQAGRWTRIALQFPDTLLADGPRVYEQLRRALTRARPGQAATPEAAPARLFLLADSSYGACCVDEVAAEHVAADVVVHYGRACLSPPARLPVVHVFTAPPLDGDAVLAAFRHTYPDKHAKVLLMADTPYSHHVAALASRLRQEGYLDAHPTDVVHNPASPLPNRTVPPAADTTDALREYALFHISDPPPSLLLTLSSRVASMHIYPTSPADATPPTVSLANAAPTLRRRYALITSLSTNPVFGILVNTLSVKNYMHMVAHVQHQIARAGKKSYTFVVGKVNAAKVANFSEVGGWVVIGCWESSLIESSEFWRPMITPWELGIALQADDERVWTGNWEADFQTVLDADRSQGEADRTMDRDPCHEAAHQNDEFHAHGNRQDNYDSEDESLPPEFDLRTGRYVSHARPMRAAHTAQSLSSSTTSLESYALAKRDAGHVAAVGGVVSPGAEFLRSQRTWQGLGSDYHQTEERQISSGRNSQHAAKMEQGRSGIAKGYVVGEQESRH